MKTKVSTKTTARVRRRGKLKEMLEARRRELVQDVHGKIRNARVDSAAERGVLDQAESSEVEIQDAIGFALIQMKADTLSRIDAALRGIEEGVYGDCVECGEEIPEARLRALPFAVRCTNCEEAREMAQDRERTITLRRGPSVSSLDAPT